MGSGSKGVGVKCSLYLSRETDNFTSYCDNLVPQKAQTKCNKLKEQFQEISPPMIGRIIRTLWLTIYKTRCIFITDANDNN